MTAEKQYGDSTPEIKNSFSEFEDYDWGSVHRKARMTGVYVFSMVGAPYCKVGSTGTPKSRHSSIVSAIPFALDFPFFVTGGGGITHIQIEKIAHRILEAHRCQGEWFKCDVSVEIEAVRQAAGHVREVTK